MPARKFTDDQEQEICRRYELDRGCARQLAQEYGVDRTTILKILKRNDVRTRSIKEALGGLTDSQEADVCRRYELEKESTKQLAKEYGVNSSTIRDILKRNDVRSRSNKEVKGGLTDDQEQEVCRRYEVEKESAPQIAKEYGVSDVTILRILNRRGVKPRSVREAHGGLTDSQGLKSVVGTRWIGNPPSSLQRNTGSTVPPSAESATATM